MTQIRHRHILICRNLLLIISAFIIGGSTYVNRPAYAIEFGEIQYNNTPIDYSKIDIKSTRKLADFYFDKAINSEDELIKKDYLQKASGEYFILSKTQQDSLYPVVQLARVYDLEGKDQYSKAYFFQALKIDKNNASTNFYFGDFYLYRKEYTKAIYFYNKAFDNGYKEDYNTLLRMAIVYEKLGDLLRANQYYKKAFLVKPNNQNLPDKIRSIENLKYQNTGYYRRKTK